LLATARGCIYVIIVHIVGWKAVVVCLVGYVIGDMERLLLLLILVLLMKNDALLGKSKNLIEFGALVA